MTTREYFIEQIEKELASARAALRGGNQGKARVSARRAAGLAIELFLQEPPPRTWGLDAMARLRQAAEEPSFPADVREAATRLTTKISDRFTYPFTTDPVADAAIIVDFLLKRA
jgi:HEPN domain-containing protein